MNGSRCWVINLVSQYQKGVEVNDDILRNNAMCGSLLIAINDFIFHILNLNLLKKIVPCYNEIHTRYTRNYISLTQPEQKQYADDSFDS